MYFLITICTGRAIKPAHALKLGHYFAIFTIRYQGCNSKFIVMSFEVEAFPCLAYGP